MVCPTDKILNPLTGRCILKVNSIKHNKSLKKLLKEPCIDTHKIRSSFTGRCIQKEKSKSKRKTHEIRKRKSSSKTKSLKRSSTKNKKTKSLKRKSLKRSSIKTKSNSTKTKSLKTTKTKKSKSLKRSSTKNKSKNKLAHYDGMLAIDICRKYKTNKIYWTHTRLAKAFNVTIPQARTSVAESFC